MGTYATQADLVLRWSSVSVGKNSQTDPAVDSDTIDAAVVAAAIASSEAYVNARLRPSIYQVPLVALSADALLPVTDWTCDLAVAFLYKKRPQGFTTDMASLIEAKQLQANDGIDNVLHGSHSLDCALLASMTTAPEVAL